MSESDQPKVITAVRGEWRPLSDQRYELGEGGRWIGGDLYFVDLLAGRLLRSTPTSGDPVQIGSFDQPLGAVAPADDGTWIAALGTGVVRFDEGHVMWTERLPADPAAPSLRVNDAAADPSGRFWFGVMAWDNTPGAGAVYRCDCDGSVREVVSGVTIPNGPAFNAEGTLMYLADTAHSVIYRYPLNAGELGPREEFARIDDGHPDGMTVDQEDCVWVAIWGGGRVSRYAADGTLLESIKVPAMQPTSVALSPVPPYRLAVTTATYGLDAPERHDGRVLMIEARVAGLVTSTYIRPGAE